MTERQSLLRGVKPPPPPIDPAVAQQFIYGTPTSPTPTSSTPTSPMNSAQALLAGSPASVDASGTSPASSAKPATQASGPSRTSLNTKIREELVLALKRIAFEREMSRAPKHTLQEIVEEALEPWLKSQGYLK